MCINILEKLSSGSELRCVILKFFKIFNSGLVALELKWITLRKKKVSAMKKKKKVSDPNVSQRDLKKFNFLPWGMAH